MSSATSPSFRVVRSHDGLVHHKTTRGVTTTAPAASPSHQVSHTARGSASVATPLKVKLRTPIVALTVVLKNAASRMNFRIPAGLVNALRPPAKRSTSAAASTVSSVLPSATPKELATEPAVVTFARNAPMNTAGRNRVPPSSTASIAMPVGNQTADALG